MLIWLLRSEPVLNPHSERTKPLPATAIVARIVVAMCLCSKRVIFITLFVKPLFKLNLLLHCLISVLYLLVKVNRSPIGYSLVARDGFEPAFFGLWDRRDDHFSTPQQFLILYNIFMMRSTIFCYGLQKCGFESDNLDTRAPNSPICYRY